MDPNGVGSAPGNFCIHVSTWVTLDLDICVLACLLTLWFNLFKFVEFMMVTVHIDSQVLNCEHHFELVGVQGMCSVNDCTIDHAL